jgi:hypothetical protein
LGNNAMNVREQYLSVLKILNVEAEAAGNHQRGVSLMEIFL